jgi:hypothetical protein
MTEVEDILVVNLIETKTDTEVALLKPLSERVEKEWLVVVKPEVVLSNSRRENGRIVTVGSKVLSVDEIHGGGASHTFATFATTTWRRNTWLQLIDAIVGAISIVCKSQRMKEVLVLSLLENVSRSDLNSKSWVHTFAARNLKVSCMYDDHNQMLAYATWNKAGCFLYR